MGWFQGAMKVFILTQRVALYFLKRYSFRLNGFIRKKRVLKKVGFYHCIICKHRQMSMEMCDHEMLRKYLQNQLELYIFVRISFLNIHQSDGISYNL